METVNISVVIATMNRPESLIKTLDCIYNKTVIPNQIVIIDQSNKNNLIDKELLNVKYCKTKINYIYQEMPSLTKARNVGINYAENDIVVYMDDDVFVNDDTIKNVNEIFNNDKSISMLAGIDEFQEDKDSIFGYIFGVKSKKNINIGQVSKSMFGKFPKNISSLEGRCETQWAMGFFFVVRKSLILKWNLCWDEKLISYAYAEDLDFSYMYYKKSKKENLKCIIDSKVKVKHNCSREWRIPSRKSTYMFIINREYLSYKHYKTPISRLRTRWANIGFLAQKLLKRENYRDFYKGMCLCDKYRKDIKKGILHSDLYK